MALTVFKKKMASFDSLNDWQVKCNGLLQRGNFLYHSSVWTDCSFHVGPSKTPVRAHRFLLAMGSPVFETMFYGSIPEGNDPIPIPDIDPIVFLQMLRYIYTDSVCINAISMAFELTYCAKKYMLPFLVKLCTQYLTENLTPHNVCAIYEHAAFHDEHQLLHDCLKMMKHRTQEILESPGFLEAHIETVVMMFSLEPLNIESELQLLEAIERYSTAQAKTEDVESNVEKEKSPTVNTVMTVDDDDDDLEMIELPPLVIELGSTDDEQQKSGDTSQTSRRKRKLRKRKAEEIENSSKDGPERDEKKAAAQPPKRTPRSAILLIRFLTLTPAELAASRAAASLLTREELFAILMNISSENTYEPMPEGFSLSRIPRNVPCLNEEDFGDGLAENEIFERFLQQRLNEPRANGNGVTQSGNGSQAQVSSRLGAGRVPPAPAPAPAPAQPEPAVEIVEYLMPLIAGNYQPIIRVQEQQNHHCGNNAVRHSHGVRAMMERDLWLYGLQERDGEIAGAGLRGAEGNPPRRPTPAPPQPVYDLSVRPRMRLSDIAVQKRPYR